MSKKIASIITDNNITVNYEGQTHIISRKDSLANDLIRALKEGRQDEIPNLVSAAKRVETFGKGHFTVDKGRILVNGQQVPEFLSRKITNFLSEGLPHQPLVQFAENLIKNPSYRAVQELFQFLEKNNHPITQDGLFIAYKKVREDFTDVHTGTFDNTPGAVLEMPRNQVDEDPASHCSHGFHVGNWRYCHEFYSNVGIMLEVEVNPADVVAVPNDLNEKIRVCKYKVLGVVNAELTDSSLHITDPSYASGENEEKDFSGVCEECGDSCEAEYDLCEGCAYLGEDNDEYPWEDEIL